MKPILFIVVLNFFHSSVSNAISLEPNTKETEVQIPSKVRTKFSVSEVSKVSVSCGLDQDGNRFFHGEDIEVETQACAVKLRDSKTKVDYWAYGAETACAYKVGSKLDLEIERQTCMPYQAQCDLQNNKVVRPVGPASSHTWFCLSAYGYLISGVVDSK